MGLEQSNTSIIYNNKYVLKFFRRIYADRNPDYEMSRFLSEKKEFKNTPAYLGSIQIKDSDEKLLKSKMISIIKELDNLVDLNQVEVDDDEVVLKFELTSKTDGGKEQLVRVPKGRVKEMEMTMEKLSNELNKDQSLKIPILVSLLKKELDKND